MGPVAGGAAPPRSICSSYLMQSTIVAAPRAFNKFPEFGETKVFSAVLM